MEGKADIYWVLLYYCYTPIKNPALFRENHHALCLDLALRGRIIVAAEGLNGTLSGTKENCRKYMDIVKSDPRFAALEFKVDECKQPAFKKLNVRLKQEIVHSGLSLDPLKATGKHLSPEKFKQMMKDQDVVLVDMRSNYEHKLGKFEGAVTLDIDHFRDLPKQVQTLDKYKDKKVVTYCTGGVKCEKASALLLERGFKEVYQLHGGIIKYGMTEGGENFQGKCYVFDNRIAVEVNKVNPKVVGKCYVCQTPSDHMVNCANTACNRHTIICEKCMEAQEGCCSAACQAAATKRRYNPAGYYTKKMNGYNPKKGANRLHQTQI